MPRNNRLDIPGIPQHIVQRGNNRLPCFLDDGDRQRYLQLLNIYAKEHGCAIHAYVLMQNHSHLLATAEGPGGLSLMMQALGRTYVKYFNRRHCRTGTLWEGRFKSCPVESDDYLLACYRYIELNPVRAKIVADPAEYGWSSFARNASNQYDPLVTPHPTYLTLGLTPEACATNYKTMVYAGLSSKMVTEIRQYLHKQAALGNDRFRKMVELKTRQFAGIRSVGRPRKIMADESIECDF